MGWLKGRLEEIAALDDHLANDRLASTGSYSGFDEPGSVKIAREILARLDSPFPNRCDKCGSNGWGAYCSKRDCPDRFAA